MKHNFEYFCKDYEKIENYQKAKKDNFKGWCCHHRLETHTSDGERRQIDITVAELKALGMYYNRPAEELMFLPVGEHISLHDECDHNPMYGKKHSEETKKKMREAKKGKYVGEKSPMYGKHHSTETRRKMREAHKGKHHSTETRKKLSDSWDYDKHFTTETRKKMSEARKGKTGPNKGKKFSEDTRKKMGEAKKGNTNVRGTRWYNNGKINIRAKECPEGFVPGILR